MIRPEAQTFAGQFAALGHANRVEILRHLLTAHPEGLVVGEIQQRLDIPGSTLSHHLEALRQEKLVVQVREGRFLRYRAGTDALRALLGFLYAECCAGEDASIEPETLIRLGRPAGKAASKAPIRLATTESRSTRGQASGASSPKIDVDGDGASETAAVRTTVSATTKGGDAGRRSDWKTW